MVESSRNVRDKKAKINSIFMDLSKSFDPIEHKLMIAKLSSYDFSADSLKLISSHLKNRNQRSIIENSYSSWEESIAGVLNDLLWVLFCSIFLLMTYFFSGKTAIKQPALMITLYMELEVPLKLLLRSFLPT